MVFLVLNIFIAGTLCFFTSYVDKKLQNETADASVILTPLLIVTIESLLFVLILAFHQVWVDGVIQWMLRFMFLIDGVFWVLFSFGLINLGLKNKHGFVTIIKWLLMITACVIVLKKFDYIEISSNLLLSVESNPVFDYPTRQFFPINWASMYTIIFQYTLPAVAYLFLMLLQEKNGTPLQQYQGIQIGESLVLLWSLTGFKIIITKANPAFSCIFLVGYVFMYSLIINAISKNSIPSKKSRMVSVLRMILSYIIPACSVGFVVMNIQPIGNGALPVDFIVEFLLLAVVAILVSVKLSQLINNSAKLYTADYAVALEASLASINYSQEMDEITEKMYQTFKNNVQSSSMHVYISDNKGTLITAYSSDKKDRTISLSNPMFDTLLNINKSVVAYTEIGHVHDISSIDTVLEMFFKETNSDAFFILNEGRNILGLITLGKRTNGDHYKDYDLEIFNKLYSYFFVFGYYMRNISNKDIISVVNREIRMSSQIITSIQENIDHAKSPKMDTGYLMVPAHNIGGEFIDMIRLTENRHLYVVGDLSGKGIAASMNMVILKSIIRTFLAETHDFKQLVVKVNSFIRDSLQKGTIFSGLFALIDFETDTMYYINCGIPTLMLYTQVYNNVIEIQGSGHILGFVKDIAPYLSVKTTKLNKGDILLTCTDGLVHSHSLRGEQFGKERIQQALLDNSTYPAQRMAQFTFDGLMKFMSKEMEDDISILVMKYECSAEYADDHSSEMYVEASSADESDNQFGEDIENIEEISDEEIEAAVANEVLEADVQAIADEEITHEDLIKAAQETMEPAENFIPDVIEESDKFSDIIEGVINSEENGDLDLPESMNFDNFDDMFKN